MIDQNNKTEPLGFVTPVEIKRHNLAYPDQKGDNRELSIYIYWKYKLRSGTYRIEYASDDADLILYPLDTVGMDTIE